VPSLQTEFEKYRARAAEDQAFDCRRIAALEMAKSKLHKGSRRSAEGPFGRERWQDAREGCQATDAIT
jgi:hypothetical protein